MIWTLILALIILWLVGWGFHVAGFLIHGVLLVAIALIIFNLATAGKKI